MKTGHKGIDWDSILPAAMSDRALAKELGVHPSTVHRARLSRNLPPYNGPHVSPDRAAKPAVDHEALAKFCRKPRTFAELCDHLDRGPSHVEGVLDDARAAGMPLNVDGDRITWHLPEKYSEPDLAVRVAQPVGGVYSFAVVGDIHFGSKYCRDDYLTDFCAKAYDRGVRMFLQTGDILDGEYKHGKRELRAHGFDEQADECIDRLPMGEGARWYFIDGNHDGTFTQGAGIVCGRALVDRARSRGRTDLTFLGQRRGVLLLDTPDHDYQPKVELWHPKKGAAYALSYHLQKQCASYEPGSKPDFLFAGHWHQFVYIVERGIHGFATGCFQGHGSAYSNALGGTQAIGAQIISYRMTEGGTIRSVTVERIPYYEREGVRTVNLDPRRI